MGKLKLEFDLENLTSDITPYNLIVIPDLEFHSNTTISLNWKVDTTEHQLPIHLSKHSKTVINFNAEVSSQITDLHLLFSQETTLGTEHSFQDEVSFQSIYLDHTDNHNAITTHLSQWMGFNPIQFSAINSYTDNNNLIYKSLIQRLSIWLLCSVLLFFIFNIPVKHLFLSMFIVWLIPTSIELSNRIKQNQQIKNSFSTSKTVLNAVDESSYQMAKTIKNELISLQLNPSIKNKIILIGSNNFFNLRLLHHLIDYNVSLGLMTSELINIHTNKNRFYIFFDRSKVYCENLKLLQGLENSVQIIHTTQDFCIAKNK